MDKFCSQKKVLINQNGEQFSYTYTITCTVNGDCYVGKTNNLNKRWKQHVYAANSGSQSLPRLYNSMRKYGIDSFEFKIDQQHQNESIAFQREIYLIEELRSQGVQMLNISGGGIGGTSTSDETRLKMSVTQQVLWSDQQRRQKQSEKLKEIWSDNTVRIRHSEIQKEWSRTPEARKNNSEAQLKETVRMKKSNACKQYWAENEEYRKKVLERTQSDENIRYQSERQTSAWQDSNKRSNIIKGMHKPEVIAARKKRMSNEGNPRSKLTWAIVHEIRIRFEKGSTMNELMTLYPTLSYSTIRRVITNKSWSSSSYEERR